MSLLCINHANLIAVLLLFSAILFQARAQCPTELCFCSKSTAEFVCDVPLLKGRCEVGQCSSKQCSDKGFRCQPKIKAGLGILSPEVIQQVRDQIEQRGGCKGNVCFAIDGSSSMDSTEYKSQLAFVSDVVKIISRFPTRVAGTQYSDRSHPIKSLSTDLNGFVAAMTAKKQVHGLTSISSGIDYCRQQVNTRPFEPKKVVVLGDGFQNRDMKAVGSANTVRSNKGLVSVVSFERGNRQLLLDIAGGDPSLVFDADSFSDRFRLGVIIRELTLAICTK